MAQGELESYRHIADYAGPIIFGLALWLWAWTGYLPGNWKYE